MLKKLGIVLLTASALSLLAEASSNAITGPLGHTPYKHLTSATELIVGASGGLPEGYWLEPLPTNQKLYKKPRKRIKPRVNNFSKKDVDILAKALYFEYRDERASDVTIGQVGHVIINRLKSDKYPDTLEEVVYQEGQFSWTHDGKSDTMVDEEAKDRSYKIAKEVIAGEIPNKVGDSTHYLNKKLSRASWWKKMDYKGKFGDHWFYEES